MEKKNNYFNFYESNYDSSAFCLVLKSKLEEYKSCFLAPKWVVIRLPYFCFRLTSLPDQIACMSSTSTISVLLLYELLEMNSCHEILQFSYSS